MPPRRNRGRRKGAARKTPAAQGSISWRIFAAGFVAGLCSTFVGLYLYTNDLDTNLGAGIRNLLENRNSSEQPVETARQGPSSSPKPVFDFYTVLPEYETVIDEKQYRLETRKTQKKATHAEPSTAYILQAASYASFKDADKLKAKLALNGLMSNIEKVTVAGKGNFFRVRLGPYSNTNTMQDADKRLKSLGIKPLHLKVRAGNG
jgi:cell division protein FtsN